ncbi:MAG: flagellar biosynthesis anti-sigma factor FlgM [Ruminococcus sp.]|jgi:anti-sigma28 factor (negative regulator of flagellin synthesis)|nr:flagellar biosynthesis anti-sigma factor FlgM [Ruminococcus sp.]
MTIDRFDNRNIAISAYGKISGAEARENRASAARAKNTDRVSIKTTDFEEQINKAKSDISRGVDSFDNEKRVSALKSAVKDGTYEVSSRDVARSILGY